MHRILLALAAVALAAGCGTTPQTSAERRTTPTPSATGQPAATPTVSRVPVAAAGGLCKLLSYRSVAAATGVEFDVAAAGAGGASCVLQVYGHSYPDLVLTSAASKADAETFHETVPPDGAGKLSGLGKAAYQVVLAPADGSGPRTEVGWLAGGRIYILRYSFEPGASAGQAKQMVGKLVGLAKQLKTG